LESFERDRPSLVAAAVVFCYMKEQWSLALMSLPNNPVFSIFVYQAPSAVASDVSP
jgi:hypothetical protein